MERFNLNDEFSPFFSIIAFTNDNNYVIYRCLVLFLNIID